MVLDFRKKNDRQRVVKTGFLKEDIFSVHLNSTTAEDLLLKHSIFFQNQVDEIKNALKLTIKVVIPKGAEFVAYYANPDSESEDVEWYDNVSYGIEGMDDRWAEKHLENITLT